MRLSQPPPLLLPLHWQPHQLPEGQPVRFLVVDDRLDNIGSEQGQPENPTNIGPLQP